MELSPAQRKLAFAVIVLALAGLGAFLLWPSPTAARGQVTAPPSATGPPAARHTAATAPATAGAAPPAGAVNIYQWLPFSQAGLDSAAAVVTRFGNAVNGLHLPPTSGPTDGAAVTGRAAPAQTSP